MKQSVSYFKRLFSLAPQGVSSVRMPRSPFVPSPMVTDPVPARSAVSPQPSDAITRRPARSAVPEELLKNRPAEPMGPSANPFPPTPLHAPSSHHPLRPITAAAESPSLVQSEMESPIEIPLPQQAAKGAHGYEVAAPAVAKNSETVSRTVVARSIDATPTISSAEVPLNSPLSALPVPVPNPTETGTRPVTNQMAPPAAFNGMPAAPRLAPPRIEIGEIEVRLIPPAPVVRAPTRPGNSGPLTRHPSVFGIRQS
jgi:hypothetical protein